MEGDQIKNIYSFIYLATKSKCDGDSRADIKHHMVIVLEAFSSLYHLWNGSHIPLSMKLPVYRTAVCRLLTQSYETWVLIKNVLKSINGFNSINSICLVIITKKGYRHIAVAPDYNLVLAIRRRRLNFIGHFLRLSDYRLLKRTLRAYTYTDTCTQMGSLLLDCGNLTFKQLEKR